MHARGVRTAVWAISIVVLVVSALVIVRALVLPLPSAGVVIDPGVTFRPSGAWADLNFSNQQTFVGPILVRPAGVTFDGVAFDVAKLPQGLPRAGIMITTWAPGAGNGSTAIEFVATSPPGTTVWFNVSGLRSDAVYQVYVDGILTSMSRAAGGVSIPWSTWSTHTFDFVTYIDTTSPIANAGPDRTASINEILSFSGLASSDDAGVVRYVWDFGDGASAQGPIVNHSYAAAGSYTVSLTVWDAVGHSASDTASVIVSSSIADTTSPAQVTDLHASSWGPDYAVLEWTAPGDDGMVGQAAAYEVRFASTNLTGAAFANGTLISTPAPHPAGTAEKLNVSGLTPGARYWFALRTADEIPNWSPVSNVAEVLTLTSWVGVPSVDSVGFNPSQAQVEIVFSEPMNHTSVEGSLTISPNVPFGVTWDNDTRVTVLIHAPLVSETTYQLMIRPHAADTEGTPLAKTFTFTFNGLPSPSAQAFFGVPSVLMLPLLVSIAALTVTSMLAGIRFHRSQRKVLRLQHVVAALARRMTAMSLANRLNALRGGVPLARSDRTRPKPRFRVRK